MVTVSRFLVCGGGLGFLQTEIAQVQSWVSSVVDFATSRQVEFLLVGWNGTNEKEQERNDDEVMKRRIASDERDDLRDSARVLSGKRKKRERKQHTYVSMRLQRVLLGKYNSKRTRKGDVVEANKEHHPSDCEWPENLELL